MKIFNYIYIASLLTVFASCSTSENVEDAPVYEEDEKAIMSQDGFQPGDAVTRSSLSYGADGLTLNWTDGDRFGVFPTSQNGSGTVVDHSQQIEFKIPSNGANGQVATANSVKDFIFNSQYGYTAYFPYKANNSRYDAIPFNFSNQTQKGYVDMGAYYTGNKYDDPIYKASETKACQHLVGVDVLISPEMKEKENGRMYFRMRHIGAIARFFLLTPAKKLKIKELKLISNNKIFSESGTVTLASHSYDPTALPSPTPLPLVNTNKEGADIHNYGVCLPQFANHQLSVVETDKTDHLTLKFNDGTSNGVWTLYGTGTNESTRYGNYFMSYMMMYPIETTADDNVYIYVTAEDESGKEVYFRTGKLAPKSMYSGYVYQWTERTTEDTPIELTATLQSWQEVASGAIETDLEK